MSALWKWLCVGVLVILAVNVSGCATQVHEDYGQYLRNNQGKGTYRPVLDSVKYYLDRKTENHSQEIRAFMVGIANSWTVRFGDLIDVTMQSSDAQHAFGQATKVAGPDSYDGLVLGFNLIDYEFSGFQANVVLKVAAHFHSKEMWERTYQATGISQGGKMFWGGAFAMKNAVQQSTKDAIDRIFANMISDLQVSLANPPARERSAVIQWSGAWFGKIGAHQIYLTIEGTSVGGRIRTGRGDIYDIVGQIVTDGTLNARFDGDAQAQLLELAGTMPALSLFSAGDFLGNVRMDRRD